METLPNSLNVGRAQAKAQLSRLWTQVSSTDPTKSVPPGGYSASSMASSRAERTMSMATSSTAVAEAVGVSTDK